MMDRKGMNILLGLHSIVEAVLNLPLSASELEAFQPVNCQALEKERADDGIQYYTDPPEEKNRPGGARQ